jgi:hypothetical protein
VAMRTVSCAWTVPLRARTAAIVDRSIFMCCSVESSWFGEIG